MSRTTLSALVGLLVVVIGALVGGVARSDHHPSSPAGASARSSTGAGEIALSDLPPQARRVIEEIDHGGPFEYPGKDGSVFGNFEHHLPSEPSGYYHEYTVDTPGDATRGTRRIIAGRNGELYYTADHYNTFQRIRR